MRYAPGDRSDELLRRMRDAMTDLLGRQTGGHLSGTLGELAAEVATARRNHVDTDRAGHDRVASARDTGDIPRSGTPSLPSGTRTPITDLSHMPPLGELYDRARRGELDDDDLTQELRGLQRRYGPYRVENITAWYERSWTRDDGSTSPANMTFTGEIRDDAGNDAGTLLYGVTRDTDGKLVVTNEFTQLQQGFTGHGFSTAFSASTEDYFRRSGVDRMRVTASMTDGGVAWAKAGYDWDLDPEKLYESVRKMQSRLDLFIAGDRGPMSQHDVGLLREMRARFDGRVVDFPSPQELVMLGGDNPKLGEELMRGSYWHGMKKL
ncbi:MULTISPECIES: hypothetical protein [unclassified Nocardia]|uniref:hypothetical protein n=1 Tax=unclassified Nocardia TaxID=2637762 RepID=UPI0024A926EA|nr:MULTISPECIES: hypothetical protein [unclassified Nocardia]